MKNQFHIGRDISNSETLPASFYRSQEVFDLMKEKVFLSSWHWVGDTSLVKSNYRVYPFIFLDQFLSEPLLLTRTGDGEIKCLSNVCTHRGNIVVHEPGEMKNLVCKYHGRKFSMDGSFSFMPEFEKAEDFPRPCDSMHSFNVRQWGTWLFAQLGGEVNFDSIEKVLDEKVGFLLKNDFYRDSSRDRDYLVNSHWALYCDNYLEGFHIPFVHKDLNQALDYGSYMTEIYDLCNVQVGYADSGTECFDLPEDHVDHGKDVAAYYFWIYPNLMLNFYPWGLSVNVVKPITINRTRVSFITYIMDETKIDNSAGALLDKVEREDEFVVEGVHKGVKSHFYKAGRFSPTREQGVHQFHRLLAEAVNS